jgi:hypothetical protein
MKMIMILNYVIIILFHYLKIKIVVIMIEKYFLQELLQLIVNQLKMLYNLYLIILNIILKF